MNEQHFLAALLRTLRSLPETRRDQIAEEYRAHFAEGRLQGRSDSEIAQSLGDPRTIGRSFLTQFLIQQIQAPPPGEKVHKAVYHTLRIIVLTASLLLFNFVFMLWPVALIALALLFLWLSVIAFVGLSLIFALALASGFLKAVVITSLNAKLTLVFYSLAGAGGGLLVLGGLYYLTHTFLLSILLYVQASIKIIKPRA